MHIDIFVRAVQVTNNATEISPISDAGSNSSCGIFQICRPRECRVSTQFNIAVVVARIAATAITQSSIPKTFLTNVRM